MNDVSQLLRMRATRFIEPLTITPESPSYTAPDDIAGIRNQCDKLEPWTANLQPQTPPTPVYKPYRGRNLKLLDNLPPEFSVNDVMAQRHATLPDQNVSYSSAHGYVARWLAAGLIECIQVGVSYRPALYRKRYQEAQ